MLPSIARALNPNSLGLVYCWDSHWFSPSVMPISAQFQPSANRPIVVPLLTGPVFFRLSEKSARKNAFFDEQRFDPSASKMIKHDHEIDGVFSLSNVFWRSLDR
jgi:hypothetical protein